MPYESSVVLITSEDKDNKNFGTGFVIDQDGGYSYILTCAHVVRNAKGKEGKAKVKVNEVIAEVETIGTLNGTDDLAVLRVEELFGVPLAGRNIGKEGLNFTSIGYQEASYITAEGKTKSGITMPLKGTLGKSTSQRIPGQKLSINLWILNIDDDVLLEGGYSGAPIVVDTDEGECAIGVLSMQYGKQILAISIEALDRVWQPPYVPFTNRDHEKNLITAYSAPPFYLLDAPAGYGKSRLLQELQKKFLEQKWICAYLVLDSFFELDKLAEVIAEKLAIPGLPPSSGINKGAGFRLGAALQRYWNNFKDRQGITLLFDFDKGFSDFKFLERLLKEFIPEIRDSLKKIAPFNSSHNKFRVVIAGRYLSTYYNRLSIRKLPIVLSLLNLTPFEYRFVHDSCIAYLNDVTTMQIAEHILYLTGGHPGCMATVLQWYKDSGMPHEKFVEEYSDRIWNEIVRLVVTNITNEFPTTFGVHELMSNNVLRYMDYTVLSKLIETLKIAEVRNVGKFDVYVLADELTGTALLNRKNYLLHDDITRRLICLGLRNDRREEFVQRCQIAQKICEERLHDKSTPTPDKWTIEYLFQFLQQHALLISKPEQRRELRTDFISQALPEILQRLVEGREEREQQSYLLDAIEEDWEFKFTVNYYLRGTEYNNDAVEELISAVNIFFEKLRRA